MLIRNAISLGANPCRLLFMNAASVVSRANWGTNGSIRNFWAGPATVISGNSIADTAAFPNGHEPPSSWAMAPKGGGLSCYNNIEGAGALAISSLSMGRALSASLSGAGNISAASMGIIVQLAAAITGSGGVSGSIQAVASMTAALAGSGGVTSANLGLIVSMLADLVGAGSVSAQLRGTASLEADIVVSGELLNTANVAQAVWNVAASLHNQVGTMGALHNARARLTKSQAFNNFAFQMFDSTSHAPQAGLTVTSQRSIDGGAFAATTNSVTEISNGWYKINLSAADLNGDAVVLRFTAASADETSLLIVTQL